MRVLLFGGYGLLGSDIYRVYRDRGHDIVRFRKNNLNLLSIDDIHSSFKSYTPDLVIHSAGFTDVVLAERKVHEAFLHNCVATHNLINVMKNTNVPIVYISTDYVFDGKKNSPYDESDIATPCNIYGWTKSISEDIIRANHPKHYIIRTSWLFGHNGKSFPSKIISRLLQGETIEVVNDQYGTPTYTLDLATALLNLDAVPYGTYHVTNSGVTTWFGLAQLIARSFKQNVNRVLPISGGDSRFSVSRPTYSVLSNQRWERYSLPMRDFPEALNSFFITYSKET